MFVFNIFIMLKFPPYKPQKLTQYIVSTHKLKNNPERTVYCMFDRDGFELGRMETTPMVVNNRYREYSPNADEYRSLFINRLIVNRRNQGIGSAFINIAKKESVRKFCLGNLHVISSNLFDKKNPPHIFYRKMGFCFNKHSARTEKYIDECIQYNEPYFPGICPNDIPMYIEKCVKNQKQCLDKLYEFRKKFKDYWEWW